MLTFKERLSSTGGFESYNLTIISEVALRQSEQGRVNVRFITLYGGQFTLSTQLIKTKLFCDTPIDAAPQFL